MRDDQHEDPEWVDLGPAEACPVGESMEVVAEGRMIAVYNVNGQVFGLDGVCPHQGGPLGKGQLAGNIVTCPWHGWQFNVESGENQITPSICQPKIAIVVRNGRLIARRDDLQDDLLQS